MTRENDHDEQGRYRPDCRGRICFGRKPQTGPGLIGQTGNKPGGSVEGMTNPPRNGLYDPRLANGVGVERAPDYEAFLVKGVVILFGATSVLGFAFGYFFGRTH